MASERVTEGYEKSAKADQPRFNSILAGIVVNNDGDATDAAPGDGVCETAAGNGICTLRAAVGEANALAGDDTIVFDPLVTLISVNGQIAISSNITMIGNGPGLLTIQNTAALSTTSRVFNITNFVVKLHGMRLSGGNVTGSGGAIQNTGNLTITNSVVSDNSASATGGGIRSTNNFTLLDSRVDGNRSTASTSGGISFAGANLTIANSTISVNNSFGNGGGINISATVSVTISNSTIRNNTAGASSGGFFTNRGTISNTTISGNIATEPSPPTAAAHTIQDGETRFIISEPEPTTRSKFGRGPKWALARNRDLNNSHTSLRPYCADISRDGTARLVRGGFTLIAKIRVSHGTSGGLPNVQTTSALTQHRSTDLAVIQITRLEDTQPCARAEWRSKTEVLRLGKRSTPALSDQRSSRHSEFPDRRRSESGVDFKLS